jgi:hypothetical protein
MAENGVPPAQWAADPTGRHRYRFWDGIRWTELVTDGEPPPPPASGPASIPPPIPPSTPLPTPPSIPVSVSPPTSMSAGTAPIAEPAFWTTPAAHAVPRDPHASQPVARDTVRVPRVAGAGLGRRIRDAVDVVQHPIPLRTHAALTVVTLGLWLLALPALYLWRRQWREWAVVWSIASVVLVILGGVLVTGQGPGPGRRDSEVVVVPDLGIAAPTSTSSTSSTARTTHPASATGRVPSTTSTRKKSRKTTPTTRRGATTTRPRTTAPASAPPTRTNTAPTTTTPTTAKATLDPRFLTCIQAKAAGYGPYRRGVDPEYAWYWDVDGDGVVCP